MTTNSRPPFITDEHLKFLDALRSRINMYGARPYLQEAFPELSKRDAQSILTYWMESFTERHGDA